MDPTQVFYMICVYGPTPLAGVLAGWQALQCKSPVQAFLVGAIGTIAMATVFGVATDYLPLWGYTEWIGQLWQMHLIYSPILGLPLGLYCAYQAAQRAIPPDQVI